VRTWTRASTGRAGAFTGTRGSSHDGAARVAAWRSAVTAAAGLAARGGRTACNVQVPLS
jgi:hypothetical protein